MAEALTCPRCGRNYDGRTGRFALPPREIMNMRAGLGCRSSMCPAYADRYLRPSCKLPPFGVRGDHEPDPWLPGPSLVERITDELLDSYPEAEPDEDDVHERPVGFHRVAARLTAYRIVNLAIAAVPDTLRAACAAAHENGYTALCVNCGDGVQATCPVCDSTRTTQELIHEGLLRPDAET